MRDVSPKPLNSVCVFCGSSHGNDPAFTEGSRALGKLLATTGKTLVYGGGKTGLMGEIAESALKHGGRVIGVMPKALVDKEVAHHGLTKLHVVASMHERKAMLTELADGFIAMPGGYGTFEEFFEVLTWAQLGMHGKPFGMLNVSDYYGGLLKFLDHATEKGLLGKVYRGLILQDADAGNLLERMATFRPVFVDKWIKKGQT